MPFTDDEPINVLLIEDNATDVRLIQELLRGASSDRFNVITASTLAQGLAHLSSDHVDVVLLDLGLPDSQGFDGFHAVNERAPTLPVVVLTVSTDEDLGRKVVLEECNSSSQKISSLPTGVCGDVPSHDPLRYRA